MGLFKSTKSTVRADKISSFSVATAEYGDVVMEVLGTTRISGNVIYYDDFTAHEHRETQKSGKGGGGHTTTTISYTYTAAIILGLCEGEISGIGNIWVNKDKYQYPNEAVGLTLFKGAQNQSPWSYLVGKHPDKALSYEGLAYMAGVVDLGSNATLSNYNFEVKGKLLNTGDGVDVNPADYIEYVLGKIGLSNIEIVGINNYREYCRQADLLISTPIDATGTNSARDIINEIAQLTNAFVFWSNNTFKIVPLSDRPVGSWQPNKTIMYDLTNDDFIPQGNGVSVSYSRKDSSDVNNRFTVEFLNRLNGYEKESVSYEDKEDILLHGVRQAPTVQAHYIYTKARAVKIAEELARKNKYERNRYTFKLSWEFCRLEPGDLVTLTDPAIGIDKQVVLIDSVTESADGILTFTALSRAEGDYSEAVYDVQENERPFIDFNFEPGAIAHPVIFQPAPNLMYNDNEVWIAAKGTTQYWGGCNVWVSDNNEFYQQVGRIEIAARMGGIASNITADATSIEVNVNGMLLSGTEQDAERGNTLCYLNDELLSYTTATLLENGNYRLDGLVRGQYNTEAVAHTAGETLVRCDDALLKTSFRDEDIGKTVYFKFTSFNIFGGKEQGLDAVSAYSYVISERTTRPGNVASLDVEVLANGTRRYYWDFEYPTPNNIVGFRMKYIQGSEPNWELAFEVQDGLITTQPYETSTVRQGIHTVMIKAVNSSGNESPGFASCVVNFAEPLEDNVLFKVDFSEDGWGNVDTNGTLLTDGYVHSTQVACHWVNPDVYYWNNPSNNFWQTSSYLDWYLTAEISAPASGNFYLVYDIEGASNITYRIKNVDSLYKPYATKFHVNAGDVIEIKFTALKNKEETILRKLMAVIDVPDRQEHFENITVPADGLELPIVTPNYYTTAVRIDSFSNNLAGKYEKEIVSLNPCKVRFWRINNDAGWSKDPVEVIADITWQGFEREEV